MKEIEHKKQFRLSEYLRAYFSKHPKCEWKVLLWPASRRIPESAMIAWKSSNYGIFYVDLWIMANDSYGWSKSIGIILFDGFVFLCECG